MFKPTSEVRKRFILEIGFSEEDANGMNKLIETMRNDDGVIKVIYGLFNQFELLLKEFTAKEKLEIVLSKTEK